MKNIYIFKKKSTFLFPGLHLLLKFKLVMAFFPIFSNEEYFYAVIFISNYDIWLL